MLTRPETTRVNSSTCSMFVSGEMVTKTDLKKAKRKIAAPVDNRPVL